MRVVKDSRGITLITLVIYIVLTTIILSAVATITAHFRRNVDNVNVQAVHDVEFDKLNLQILRETKAENNLIETESSTTTSIKFVGTNNTYIYDNQEKALYLNNNIKVAEHIQSIEFILDTTDGGQSLFVKVVIDGKQRITEYIVERRHTDHNIPTIKVGDYVNYEPITDTHTVLQNLTNSSSSQEFTTKSNLTWRVSSIDEDNETISIIATTSGGELYLKGECSGSTVLEDICVKLYSNSDYNAIARSAISNDQGSFYLLNLSNSCWLADTWLENGTTYSQGGLYIVENSGTLNKFTLGANDANGSYPYGDTKGVLPIVTLNISTDKWEIDTTKTTLDKIYWNIKL